MTHTFKHRSVNNNWHTSPSKNQNGLQSCKHINCPALHTQCLIITLINNLCQKQSMPKMYFHLFSFFCVLGIWAYTSAFPGGNSLQRSQGKECIQDRHSETAHAASYTYVAIFTPAHYFKFQHSIKKRQWHTLKQITDSSHKLHSGICWRRQKIHVRIAVNYYMQNIYVWYM